MKDLPHNTTRSPVPPPARDAADGPETTAPLRVGWPRLLAWLPIPVLLVAIAVLWAANLPGSYESPYLLMALNLVFSTLVSGFIAYLIGRSFLIRGTPGLLMLGCGVIIWGTAGLVGIVASHFDINVFVTIHNLCVWLSALCHLAGAVLSLRPRRAMREASLWLAAAYTVALGCVGLVTLSALAGWTPIFFVQGQGGTPLRYLVLGSATAMFVLAAVLLKGTSRRPLSAFLYWYTLALGLIAVGLFGIMIESVHAGSLSWTGRAAQFLGGAYMLIAAIASVRESGRWGVTLPTEVKEAREAVRASEERYRMLFETMVEGFALHEIITDEHGQPCDYRFLEVNPAFERLTGLKRADLIGKRVREVLPGTESHWVENYGKVAIMGEPLHMENYSAALKRWYEVFAYRTAPGHFAAVFADITERKRAEESLRESEERHRLLAETMLQGVVHQDADGKIIAMNSAAERILGKTPEQFLGSSSTEEEHHTIREDGSPFPGLEHPAMVALRTGQQLSGVVMGVFNPKVDAYRWISIDAVPIFRPGENRPSEVYTVFEDITDRKRAEEALRESEQRYRAIGESIDFGVWMCDSEGRNIYASDSFLKLVGITQQQCSEFGWGDVLHPDDAEHTIATWKECVRTRRNMGHRTSFSRRGRAVAPHPGTWRTGTRRAGTNQVLGGH